MVEEIENAYYKTILQLVSVGNHQTLKVVKLELKTAISILPAMDDNEEPILRLIGSIKLYEQMLKPTKKNCLLKCVLKLDLLLAAKLRLDSNYDTVQALITALKAH